MPGGPRPGGHRGAGEDRDRRGHRRRARHAAAAPTTRPGAAPGKTRTNRNTSPDAAETKDTPRDTPARRAGEGAAGVGESDLPRYLSLTRKEARIRDDQAEALATLSRRLMRSRRGAGAERITDNTLIRIGIDLLLQHADQIEGATEDELRKSVSL